MKFASTLMVLSLLGLSSASSITSARLSKVSSRVLAQQSGADIATDSAQLNVDLQAFAQSFFADPATAFQGLFQAFTATSLDFQQQIGPVLAQQQADTYDLFTTFTQAVQSAFTGQSGNTFQEISQAVSSSASAFQTAFADLAQEAQQQYNGFLTEAQQFEKDPAGTINAFSTQFANIQSALTTQALGAIDGLVKQLDGLVQGFQADPTATLESLERQFVATISQAEQGLVAAIKQSSQLTPDAFVAALEQFIA